MPPKTPSAISRIGRLAVRLMSSGLTKLSMLLMTATPQITMKIAQPVWPWS